jgi:hypothetical protein
VRGAVLNDRVEATHPLPSRHAHADLSRSRETDERSMLSRSRTSARRAGYIQGAEDVVPSMAFSARGAQIAATVRRARTLEPGLR